LMRPTPTIGGVGLIKDWSKMARIRFAAAGETILLAGAPEGWGTQIAQSVYMRDIHGRTDGPAPHVDLAHERKVGDFVRGLIEEGLVTAVHDCSSGGLALAVAEMAIASDIGAAVEAPAGRDPIPVFYGEDQGRYVVTVAADNVDTVAARAKAAGVALPVIGKTGGDAVKLGEAKAVSVNELRSAHEGWFPNYMGGDLAPDN
jgi:phosphoribosylformylglycinamidine synthase subunit PurL